MICLDRSSLPAALFVVLALSGPVAIAVPPPSAPLTPDEEGSAELGVRNNCLGCHSEEMLAQQRITEKQWEAVIKKMQGWGSPLEAETAPLVVRYLARRSAVDEAPYEPLRIDASAAARAIEALADGSFRPSRAKPGRDLFQNLCVPCHAVDGRGGEIGTALIDRPILWRASEFAAITRGGRGRMPSFDEISDAQIGAILQHLRTMSLTASERRPKTRP